MACMLPGCSGPLSFRDALLSLLPFHHLPVLRMVTTGFPGSGRNFHWVQELAMKQPGTTVAGPVWRVATHLKSQMHYCHLVTTRGQAAQEEGGLEG